MIGRILVLHGRTRSYYDILDAPPDEDDDALIDTLNDFEGVAWVNRDYGELSLVISLEGDSNEALAETGNRLYDYAVDRGYRLRQIITVG